MSSVIRRPNDSDGSVMFAGYPDIVSTEDLMRMLGVGRNTAYTLLQEGSICSFRIGKCYKIIKQSIIDFAQSKHLDMYGTSEPYLSKTSDGLLVNEKEG